MSLVGAQAMRHASKYLAEGYRLSESKWGGMTEKLKTPYDKAVMAMILENQREFNTDVLGVRHDKFGQLIEATTSPHIATFEKYSFPMIRAVFPNLIITDLVTTQPMTSPSSLVFFMQFLYGSSKGQIQAGQTMIGQNAHENADYNYSSDMINDELYATGTGGVGPYNHTTSYVPIRKGSVVIKAGSQQATDNGSGVLAGAATGTVDYNSGAIVATFGSAVASGEPIYVTYSYNNECSDQVPEVDLLISSAPVTATIRKLKARWCIEAAANAQNVQGIDIEAEMSMVIAQELRFAIDREIISQLLASAGAGAVTFNLNAPAGISFTEHKLSFIDTLVQGSNLIYQKTRMAAGNWIVCGMNSSNIIETLPNFVPSSTANAQGVSKIGVLQGKWAVYKDPWMNANKFLIGFKGNNFLHTGFIYAPYVPMYATGVTVLDDFVARMGIGTQYGRRMVNANFYVEGTITNDPS